MCLKVRNIHCISGASHCQNRTSLCVVKIYPKFSWFNRLIYFYVAINQNVIDFRISQFLIAKIMLTKVSSVIEKQNCMIN